jgi:hypothetical protein
MVQATTHIKNHTSEWWEIMRNRNQQLTDEVEIEIGAKWGLYRS